METTNKVNWVIPFLFIKDLYFFLFKWFSIFSILPSKYTTIIREIIITSLTNISNLSKFIRAKKLLNPPTINKLFQIGFFSKKSLFNIVKLKYFFLGINTGILIVAIAVLLKAIIRAFGASQ